MITLMQSTKMAAYDDFLTVAVSSGAVSCSSPAVQQKVDGSFYNLCEQSNGLK
jgi:hypothetical protein